MRSGRYDRFRWSTSYLIILLSTTRGLAPFFFPPAGVIVGVDAADPSGDSSRIEPPRIARGESRGVGSSDGVGGTELSRFFELNHPAVASGFAYSPHIW